LNPSRNSWWTRDRRPPPWQPLAAVVYVLTLATRLVRAIERIANKSETKTP